MDNQILEVLQKAPSFKKAVEKVCQDFAKLLDRVEELEEISSDSSKCQTNDLMMAKLAVKKAQAEAKALRIELDNTQRRAKEAETAKAEAEEATSKLEELKKKLALQLKEPVKAHNAQENVLRKELEAVKVELDNFQCRAKMAEEKAETAKVEAFRARSELYQVQARIPENYYVLGFRDCKDGLPPRYTKFRNIMK